MSKKNVLVVGDASLAASFEKAGHVVCYAQNLCEARMALRRPEDFSEITRKLVVKRWEVVVTTMEMRGVDAQLSSYGVVVAVEARHYKSPTVVLLHPVVADREIRWLTELADLAEFTVQELRGHEQLIKQVTGEDPRIVEAPSE